MCCYNKFKGSNKMKSKIFFGLLLLVIGYISAYDLYLAISFSEELILNEQNPLGRYLIKVNNGNIALFMGLKFAGTITCLAILVVLYQCKKSWAWICISAITLFQISLLLYLITY